MRSLVRTLGFAAATALLAAGARAETVRDDGFEATFPCQTKVARQTLAAATQTMPLVSHSCIEGSDLYNVSVSLYPDGLIAKRTLKVSYRDAVRGAAENVNGTVRRSREHRLGRVTGRDALIDVPSQHVAAHLRVYFVGDWQFQVMFVGPKGRESGKRAMAFLDSFRLEQ